MKKFKISDTIIVLFLAIIIVLAFVSIEKSTMESTTDCTDIKLAKSETRIIEATVEGVSTNGTNVLFRGNDGNLWSADSGTKMYRGQQVIIELSSNGTEQIEDDEILNIWLT